MLLVQQFIFNPSATHIFADGDVFHLRRHYAQAGIVQLRYYLAGSGFTDGTFRLKTNGF